MAETSAIQWTDATVNFWWGCTEVGPGCERCYARTLNAFRGNREWGPGAPRRKIKGAMALIRKLQRDSDAFEKANGRRRRVFMHSMSDLFDNEVDPAWRAEAFAEAEAADRLELQFVTKRVGNVMKMVPGHWKANGWPGHIGLLITVCTQAELDRDLGKLQRLKQWHRPAWVGLSVEPMLGPMDLGFGCKFLDWVIVGGESGRDARPMHPDWARALRDQCRRAGIPLLFKQWGEWLPWEPERAPYWVSQNGSSKDRHALFPVEFDDAPGWDDGLWAVGEANHAVFQRVGKTAAGRLLDGIEHNGFPMRRAA